MSAGGRDREDETQLLYGEIDGRPMPLVAEDLTLAGLFVQTTRPPKLDRELYVFLRSSIGEAQVRGQVVQVVDSARAKAEKRRPGFGLLFTDLSNDQRAFLGLTLDAIWRAKRDQEAADAERAAEAEREAEREAKQAAERSRQMLKAAEREAHAAALHGQAEKVASELRTELAGLQGKTPWTALGLEPEASIGRAKEAFLERSKHCHPHRYARHDSREVTRLATELFIAYKRSYSVITKLAPRGENAKEPSGPAPARRTLTSIIPVSSGSSVPPKAGAQTSVRTSTRPRSR